MTTGNSLSDPTPMRHPGNPNVPTPRGKGYDEHEIDVDDCIVTVEYEDHGTAIELHAVWAGPWNVMPLLTSQQEAHVIHEVEQHAWDL